MKIGKIKQKQTKIILGQTYNPEYIFTDNLDIANYNDVTSIVNWDGIGMKFNSYDVIRNEINNLITTIGFDNLTDDEKRVCVKYQLPDKETLINHFITTDNLTPDEAETLYYENELGVYDNYYVNVFPTFEQTIGDQITYLMFPNSNNEINKLYFDKSDLGDEIIFKKTGRYLIICKVSLQSTSSKKLISTVSFELSKDGNYNIIDGTKSFANHKDSDNGNITIPIISMVNVKNNDKLRVRMEKSTDKGIITTIPDSTSLIIIKMN